jgi:Tol biopolymer transport system component
MRATLVYGFNGTDERRINVDLGRDDPCPVVSYDGTLFVLRSYVLGFVDNVSREGADGNLYIQTHAWDQLRKIE